MMKNARDRNIIKCVVALPLAFYALYRAVRFALSCVGLEQSGFLAALGALQCAYVLARARETARAWEPRWACKSQAARFAAERAELSRTCGGGALVTGCTAGLGKAWARGLCARGQAVLLVSRSQVKLDALAAELRSEFNADVETLAFDFATGDAKAFYTARLPAALERFAKDRDGTYVGLVVNNVGVGTEDPLYLDEIDAEDCDAMVAINCGATTRMCRAVLSDLEKRGGGCVLNVSSGSSAQPTPFVSLYAATKAFVVQLSRSLDREWRPRGVRVLAIAPYYISDTGLFKATKPSINAPPPRVVVDGALKTLCSQQLTHVELTFTNPAHAFIAAVLQLAEDPVLGPLLAQLAKPLGANGSMLAIMTKARARFLRTKAQKQAH